MKEQEFKNYIVNYLSSETLEDVTIEVKDKHDDNLAYFFIKPLEIADVDMIIYGAFGNHSVLINLNNFDINKEVENIFKYMNHYGTSTFKVDKGI